jgi:hypothetical protein
MPTGQADEAAIREQAYLFWEEDGRPEGRDTEFWMRAKVAVSEKGQMDKLVEPAPKVAKKPKAEAAKSKASPAKAEAPKKGKKK